MKTHRLISLRLICLALWLTGLSGGLVRPAFAQHHPVYSSLEAQFTEADSVCIGTIAEVGEPQPTKYGTPIMQVTLDVTETLKGEKHKRYPVFLYLYSRSNARSILQEKSRKRTPLLAFIRHRRNDQTDADGPDRTAELFPINPTEDDSNSEIPTVGYFSMDFRLLRTPRQVLDAVHRYAKKAPKTATMHAFIYIPDLIRKQFPYSTGGELLVPVAPQLEPIARRMILTPASFLPAESEVHNVSHTEYLAFQPVDEGNLRRIGVQALAHFQSKANIELLKRQLSDPFIERRTDPTWEGEKDVYSVRKFAFDTLKKWGVKVAEPQLHPPLAKSTDQ